MVAKKLAAKKAASKKIAAKKSPAKSPVKDSIKPIKETLGKTGLIAYIADHSGVDPKLVRKVIATFEDAIAGSVSKKGAGTFILPGYLKISAVKVPAKPKRKGINRFTGQEQWFAAKPASSKIKVRPLKKLKDAST